jgi:hypothetical protein
MPALTRRRDRNLPQECWCIYYGDVHAGTIMQRSAIPAPRRGGNGGVASIRALGRANAQEVPRRALTKLEQHSKLRGACSYRSAQRPTSRSGASSRLGPLRNTAASIGANGCRPIGGQRENHHPDCPWEVALLTLQRRQSDRAAGGLHANADSGIERALLSGRTGMPQRSADKIRMPGNRTFGAAV